MCMVGCSCSPGIMCAVECYVITLVTADEGCTGCVWDEMMIGMLWGAVWVEGKVGVAFYANPAYCYHGLL